MPPTGLLLYDADCGICTRAAGLLQRLRLAYQVHPLQSVDLPANGIDPARADREIPAVAPDRRVSYGVAAIAAALGSSASAPVRLAGAALGAPLIAPVARLGYRLVADNRHRFPGSSCAVPPPDAR
ncbi:thiol-disulfide oxidoreductase DCC family protein [Granulicoccus phenolivorans]|uniref:thiol-disulfide oxidoreductase DCC family protein n=1 Tax=Granulicoccus phenolivorans TaxID=266854 RepID=UPI00047DA595|nr:DCC1-like thiol-disulfide oxidoreductase family protein [Granulicoccus phenolivorans]